MSSIQRRFGPTVALAGVDLQVQRGEVHALVGENGAGKSTLTKILCGAETADSGSILLDGKPFEPKHPRDALNAGLAMIYQELNLAPHLSVQANLTLGQESTAAGFLRGELPGAASRRECRAALDRLGLRVSLDTTMRDLGVAEQQMVEIARALLGKARLIVMDEPTSALASHEVEQLFKVVNQLRSEGVAIIYISHFLEEIERIADSVTVLRDGRTVGTAALSSWTRQKIIEAMVGRHVEEMYPRVPHAIGQPLLTVQDLRGRKAPRHASFTLRRGEILGIAGLVGAGRTEMLRALFGLDVNRGGSAVLNGVKVQEFAPKDWANRGVGLLSEDRKAEGLAQNVSCVANITLSSVRKAARFGWINGARERRRSHEIGQVLRIRWASPEQRVSGLSGGNQQKVAMARLLYSDADVLLLDEPTRGIDVGAKVDLYRAVGELAARGKAVVMVSSYLPELFGVCDTIAVMSRGVLSKATPVESLTPERVMQLAVEEQPIVAA
jgi:ribose transport system ATP-binding protein